MPLMSMPRIAPATASASSAVRASFTPPALPRPPTSTCALTTTPSAPAARNACGLGAGLARIARHGPRRDRQAGTREQRLGVVLLELHGLGSITQLQVVRPVRPTPDRGTDRMRYICVLGATSTLTSRSAHVRCRTPVTASDAATGQGIPVPPGAAAERRGVATKPRGTARQGFGTTLRVDRWIIGPAAIGIGFTAFIVYSIVSSVFLLPVFGFPYEADGYLSPFFSPLIVLPFLPDWFSPAFLILWIPLGFRATCYYYRKAYYRAYFFDPPACAVGEPSVHRSSASRPRSRSSSTTSIATSCTSRSSR